MVLVVVGIVFFLFGLCIMYYYYCYWIYEDGVGKVIKLVCNLYIVIENGLCECVFYLKKFGDGIDVLFKEVVNWLKLYGYNEIVGRLLNMVIVYL